jgi:nickel-dependent lactate racemase
MPATLKYGENREVALELPSGTLVAQYGPPTAEPLDDVAAAMAATLVEPIDFPPLCRTIVPGDRIAIVLDHALPQAPALVAGLVQSLCEADIVPDDITVVWTAGENGGDGIDPREQLPDEIAARVQFLIHDPADQDALRYLAVSSENQPIYLNRAIQDADVVLPIGCLRAESAAGYHGIHSVLFPTYSDTEALGRYHAASNEDSEVPRRRRQKETDEAAWLLGVTTSIQVIPGAGGSILKILAGDPKGVRAEGHRQLAAVWQHEVNERAQLVIAGIEGDARSQTWENVARAVTAALEAVEDGGIIAVCCELANAPGKALQQLALCDDYKAARHEILRQRSADAVPAAQLLAAMQRARIFLLSQLDDEVVSELGLGPVADETEIVRLGNCCDSCILLAAAQYADTTAASN